MIKKSKRSIALLLLITLSMGISTTALAAEQKNDDKPVIIKLFDPNDPNLIEIVDVEDVARTTTRPTRSWNMDVDGLYTYSAYSNNNIMWTKYVFFDPGNLGYFYVTAKSTNTNYRMIVHDGDHNRDYIYRITGTNIRMETEAIPGWTNTDTFYFGIDTTQTKGAVSVNGTVGLSVG